MLSIAPPGSCSRAPSVVSGRTQWGCGRFHRVGRDAPTRGARCDHVTGPWTSGWGGESLVEGARTIIEVQAAVAFLKRWLQEPRLVVSELVLITRRAIAARRGEAVLDGARRALGTRAVPCAASTRSAASVLWMSIARTLIRRSWIGAAAGS